MRLIDPRQAAATTTRAPQSCGHILNQFKRTPDNINVIQHVMIAGVMSGDLIVTVLDQDQIEPFTASDQNAAITTIEANWIGHTEYVNDKIHNVSVHTNTPSQQN